VSRTQASLAIELALHGDRPAFFRAVNVGLHTAVLALALVVARLVLRDEISAALATLAFALTPKAPAIAVLWISGRAELLMALFAFASVAAWIAWLRHGGAQWLVATAVAYLAAAGSKETAFALPLLLVLIPAERPRRTARVGAIAPLLALGAALLVWARARWRPDADVGRRPLHAPHRTGARAAERPQLRRSPAPCADRVDRADRDPANARSTPTERSDASTTDSRDPLCAASRVDAAVWRAAAMHRDLQFSATLIEAFRADADLANRSGAITLVPADADTGRLLQDSIGGYLYSVLHRAFPDGHLTGVTEYAGMHVTGTSARVRAEYRDGRVLLMRESELR